MSKQKNKPVLPSLLELFQESRSPHALAVILRNGGGTHKDKRRAPERKHDWKREVY
jgi:hypothetical protein